jgi:hypothetical protein
MSVSPLYLNCPECSGWGEWLQLVSGYSRMVCCPVCNGSGHVETCQQEVVGAHDVAVAEVGPLPEPKRGYLMHTSTFGYLKPTDKQNERMTRVREAAAVFAAVLEEELPEGPDKTWAIRNHRTTAMWANVAVTRLPDGTPRQD